jgi:hypothetical protein
MDARFEIAPLPAGFVFGQLATSILDDLARRYENEAGIKVKHWAMWVFSNGGAVPVPTQIDNSLIPAVRACQLLKQTLQQVAHIEMRTMTEADKFNINTAISHLDELHSLGAV